MDEGLLNDLLECSVCLERLDTSSRVLPCQHTFCLKCLKVIVESHKELRCPECRILVEAKVEELPPNVLLMRILEGMKNSAPRKPGSAGQRQRTGHSQALALQQAHKEKQLPPHARAMYDFISKEPGDLSFKKGETILLQKKLDAFWYHGECSGRSGMFPITYVQIVVPLPVPTALCKALYDFRMSAPDEEGCLAFDKGAIITVHRRVDENWAEGRLEQRVGIFPIAFVELNQPAKHLINSTSLSRPVPPPPELQRALEQRHHPQPAQRFHQMSISSGSPPAAQVVPSVGPMSHSHPHYSHNKHGVDLIHFNVHKSDTVGLHSVARIQDYDRQRKFDHYSTPVHRVDATYQNIRTEHFPTSVANFNANNVSSDSSSGHTVSAASSAASSSNSSDSRSPSLPSSPQDAERTAVEQENQDTTLDTSMGVLSLNESSTATNTSLNVSLPPSESPKANSNSCQGESEGVERLDVASSSKNVRSGPESMLNFGLGLQAALSPSHTKDGYLVRNVRDHHREKRHSLTPSTHLQGHSQNRHSAEIIATSLLDNGTEASSSGATCTTTASAAGATNAASASAGRARRRRASRSSERGGERGLPAPYIALYPYKPQKPDELELVKGGVYTVTERCRDGWYKGCGERGRAGVFPGNYVTAHTHTHAHTHAAAHTHAPPDRQRHKQDKQSQPARPAPDAPPRAHSPSTGQPLSYPWTAQAQPQQPTTPRSEKCKDKKAEKCSSSSGVSLMKRLAAMKRGRSPPASCHDNPVFDLETTTLATTATNATGATGHHAVHVRSGSCPSQLLRALPPAAARRERCPTTTTTAASPHQIPAHTHRAGAQGVGGGAGAGAGVCSPGAWPSQHRKSQSLDVSAQRRDRHAPHLKERFRCIVPYPPNSEYELELKVDDIVVVSKKRGDGWYKGTLQRTGRTGLFPASFVQSAPD